MNDLVAPSAQLREKDDALVLSCAGTWSLTAGRAFPAQPKIKNLSKIHTLQFDLKEVTSWDSSLPVFLTRVIDQAETQDISPDFSTLPAALRRLLNLATSVPERVTTNRKDSERDHFVTRIGKTVQQAITATVSLSAFLGESTLSFLRLAQGKRSFRLRDFFQLLQETGSGALPIVGLISVLVGLILAFVGAIQLQQFGAEIYVADLVGIAMVREMGALMAGIIMAGRSGAAFAAHIGSMQANEEVDALTTLGINSFDYLVVPRVLALILTMPLLCLYADLLGILGGMIIACTMLDLQAIQFFNEIKTVVNLTQIGIGVFKAAVFGAIIAASGCYFGIRSGRSAAAVGEATTSAVVAAIVYIVIADALFAAVLNSLGL